MTSAAASVAAARASWCWPTGGWLASRPAVSATAAARVPAAIGHCGARPGARAQTAPARAQTSTTPTATPSSEDRPPGTCTRSPASATAAVTTGRTTPVIRWPAAAPRGRAAAAGPWTVPFTGAPAGPAGGVLAGA